MNLTRFGRHIAIMLVGVWFALSTAVASSQNNPYKISDSLYTDFVRVQNMKNNPKVLTLADSLYHEAEKISDHKAQCALLCTPVQYAHNQKDTEMMDKVAQRCREEALKYNYPQYYYFAWKTQIALYANLRKLPKAMTLLVEMENDTRRYFNGYGRVECYMLYGNIYKLLQNEDEAIRYYELALDLSKRQTPQQDNESIYTPLATCYRYKKMYEKSLEVINEGLDNIKDPNIKVREFRMLDNKCFTLYFCERYDEAEAVYQKMQDPKFDTIRKSVNTTFVDIYHYLYHNDFGHALSMAHDIKDEATRYAWLSKIEKKRGNYLVASDYSDKAYTTLQDSYRQMRNDQYAQMNAEMGNNSLKAENAELLLRSSNLALHNAELALNQERSQSEMHRINSRNDSLNNALRLEQMEARLQEQQSTKKLQEAEYQRSVSRSQARSIFFASGFALTLIVLFWTLTSQRTRRANLNALADKNKELTAALHRAEESEAAKMRFLQNMSHEIRTPLNAIVGFSQLLAHSNDFSQEQVDEFVDLIDRNTDTLTNLIDDILSLSALENGKQMKLNLDTVLVNDLCRKALATVKARCPEGVELRFTTTVDDSYSFISDALRVQQVITNYLTNAEKHTTEGEILLHVSLSENPGMLTFSVTDTGEGVPADKAEVIFDRFEKIDSFVQGTGLGLNICKMIAQRLNGVVKLDTTHTSKGARFVFIVPLEQNQ
ncbi:MAG: ATP-binding protein [Muribaculaceae bacterium]